MSQVTLSYSKVKKEVFQLPLEKRLELLREIKKRDIDSSFAKAHRNVSKKVRASGYTLDDVNSLISEIREQSPLAKIPRRS
jgi:hypothetical protein